MWKLYDWQCTECGWVREHFVRPDDGQAPPSIVSMPCGCIAPGQKTKHERLISAPAKYLGDRPMAPRVYGGKNDTAGYRDVPKYPEVRDGVSYERREVEEGRTVPTKVMKAGALIEHQNTREWKEVHRARQLINKENMAKRKRLPTLRAGLVNLRDTKLPGDPKLTEKRKPTNVRR